MTTQTTRTEHAYDPDAAVRWAYRKGLSLRKLRDGSNITRAQMSAIFILVGVMFGGNTLFLMRDSLFAGIANGLLGYALVRKGVTNLVWLYRSERAARDEQFTTAVEIEESRDDGNCTINRGTATVKNYRGRTRGVSVGYTRECPCVFIDINEDAIAGLDYPLQAAHALEHAVIKEHRRQHDTFDIGGQAANRSTLSESGANIVFHSFGDAGEMGALYEEFESVLQDAREVLDACVCPGDDGCHNCCHTITCGQDNRMINSTEAVELADTLLGE